MPKAVPYKIDSKVRGLPLLKYKSTVSPLWLNNTLKQARHKAVEIAKKTVLNAPKPLSLKKYVPAPKKHAAKTNGCSCVIHTAIARKKNKICTKGFKPPKTLYLSTGHLITKSIDF